MQVAAASLDGRGTETCVCVRRPIQVSTLQSASPHPPLLPNQNRHKRRGLAAMHTLVPANAPVPLSWASTLPLAPRQAPGLGCCRAASACPPCTGAESGRPGHCRTAPALPHACSHGSRNRHSGCACSQVTDTAGKMHLRAAFKEMQKARCGRVQLHC